MRLRLVLSMVFVGTTFAGTAFGQPPAAAADPFAAEARAFRISLSVSPFTEAIVKSGVVFTDGKIEAKTPRELQRLFMKYGATEVYARIATSRHFTLGAGNHSLDLGLARARMAQSLHLPLNPELGLFKNYGDVRCQPPPDFSQYPEIKTAGPWESLTIDQMTSALRSYGAIVARMILATGVKVMVWDIGNEVEFGTAGVAPQPLPGQCQDTAGGPGWYKAPNRVDPEIGKMSIAGLIQMPEARRIAWLQLHVWPYGARLLAAVAEGVRSVDPGAQFSTHVSGFTALLPNQAVAFYRAMKQGGFLPDQLGFSFYPSGASGTANRLKAFQQTVTAVHAALNRPVFIAEFGYPAKPVRVGPYSTWNHPLPGYPLTPQGQADMLRDLAEWGITHNISGIRPWGPDTVIPGWEPLALFDRKDKIASPRPALAALAEAAHSREP